jgi:hypothetical protein
MTRGGKQARAREVGKHPQEKPPVSPDGGKPVVEGYGDGYVPRDMYCGHHIVEELLEIGISEGQIGFFD